MLTVIITLLSISVVLFILSFFANDRMKKVEDQVEQLSMEMMQSNYQFGQKLKVLEEELLAEDLTGEIIKQNASSSHSKMDTIYSMYSKGFKPHYIAKQTNVDEQDVLLFIQQWDKKGVLS
ncbi:hypothetical protein [Halobacillus salinus]|uniref:hypothetical protein n=1 Tax=Halobacillus salinus TaxID=192814 RepID=UPI0015924DFA|nr:hypothetical protein [Halobacillus salinus]